MDVIIYKILSYLYGCAKSGKRPRIEDICHDCSMFHIPQSYWNMIMEELIHAGYVSGFMIKATKSGNIIFMTDSARITLEGVHFLQDNSKMQKVKAFLGTAFNTVLQGIIEAII